MRKSDVFFIWIGINLALAGLAFVYSHTAKTAALDEIRIEERMVKELNLTDLCLFTEARYTRHPSQADLHAPFQDHPMSLEHYPSGFMISPPPALRGN
jgi:hypothetical protein